MDHGAPGPSVGAQMLTCGDEEGVLGGGGDGLSRAVWRVNVELDDQPALGPEATGEATGARSNQDSPTEYPSWVHRADSRGRARFDAL